MNVELDVEKRMQALVLKDRIRIKEFFIDFDKLRKGYVGEAGVSIYKLMQIYFHNEMTLLSLSVTLNSFILMTFEETNLYLF